MKSLRFFRIFCLMACFLSGATTVFAQPVGNLQRGDFPDFSYSAALSRSMQSDCMTKIRAIPEFQEFFDALTAKIDAEHSAGDALGDYFLDKVRKAKGKTNISSKDVIELIFTQIELIQFEAFVKKAYDEKISTLEPAQGMLAIYLAGEYGRLTIVTKFSLAEFDDILDFLPPDEIKIDMIKAEEDDFLVSFGPPNNDEIKLFVGGQKLEGRDSYVTVISFNRELVEQKLALMQSERIRRFLLGDNAAFETVYFGKGVFEVVQAIAQTRIDLGIVTDPRGDKIAVRIAEQINGLSIVTRDMDGKTVTQIRFALTGDDFPEELKELVTGLKGLSQMLILMNNMDADMQKLVDFVWSTEFVSNGTTQVATINWSSEAFLEMLRDGFKKGLLLLADRGGEKEPEELPKLYASTFTLIQEGTPLADAIISLVPVDSANGQWWAGGVTDAQGIMHVKTMGQYNGAPAGIYKIIVSKIEAEETSAPEQNTPKVYNLVEKEYRSAATTPLEVEIKPGKNAVTIDVGKAVRELILVYTD